MLINHLSPTVNPLQVESFCLSRCTPFIADMQVCQAAMQTSRHSGNDLVPRK